MRNAMIADARHRSARLLTRCRRFSSNAGAASSILGQGSAISYKLCPEQHAASHIRHLNVVDLHAEGEPARIVVGGMPPVPGDDMKEVRKYFMENLDDYRKLLLHEPRGYPCQNADFIVPSTRPDAAFGVVIAEQGKIYPAMSGHNIMCVATALLETGMVPMEDGPTTEFALDLPAGLVRVRADCAQGKAQRIELRNAPAFCRPEDMDVVLDVPHVGRVTVDIAYGGMFYVIVDASSIGLTLEPSHGREICRLGEMIKTAAKEQHPLNHPEFDYPGPDILVFRQPSSDRRVTAAAGGGRPALHAKNAVVMSNGTLDWTDEATWTGMLDRSPCGTGTCAVMAALHARGELALHEDFVHSSIIGTTFHGQLHEEETLVDRVSGKAVQAVVPTIAGRAWITQYATVVCDRSDPFPEGYTVGDIW